MQLVCLVWPHTLLAKMPANSFVRYHLKSLLLVSLGAQALSTPFGREDDWAVGKLPTIDRTGDSAWDQTISGGHDRVFHDLTGHPSTSVHWNLNSPGFTSEDTLDIPESLWHYNDGAVDNQQPSPVTGQQPHPNDLIVGIGEASNTATLPAVTRLHQENEMVGRSQGIIPDISHHRGAAGQQTIPAWRFPGHEVGVPSGFQSVPGLSHQIRLGSDLLWHPFGRSPLVWQGGPIPSPQLAVPLPTETAWDWLSSRSASSLRGTLHPALQAPFSSHELPPETSHELPQSHIEPAQPYDWRVLEASMQDSSPETTPKSLQDLWRFLSIFGGSLSKQHQWEQALRNALGMEDLQIKPADLTDDLKDQVFTATGAQTVEGYHPPLDVASASESENTPGVGHFLGHFQHVRTQKVEELRTGGPGERIYVYLNSRTHLDFLNKEYFLNHLQFFPVRSELLTWTHLNALHARRTIQYVLPPRGPSGLSLILARHDTRRSSSWSYVQKLTGHTDTSQTVSLWSPVLYVEGKFTIILYGVGQLDHSQMYSVLDHLKRLNDITAPLTYSPFYQVSKLTH